MDDRYSRSERLIGAKALARLKEAHVAVFGLGGVGSFAAEALARSGVGRLTLIDGDTVAPSNLNRQLGALGSTLGMSKAVAAAGRIGDIDPDIAVTPLELFYLPGQPWPLAPCDYVLDAVDTVAAKLAIAQECQRRGLPLISAMGAGNKLDPSRLQVADIFSTDVCPLCRVMRHELKKLGVPALKVVYSKEPPACADQSSRTPASMIFVPGSMGLMLAREVIIELTAVQK